MARHDDRRPLLRLVALLVVAAMSLAFRLIFVRPLGPS
jgi:hypothetical protein